MMYEGGNQVIFDNGVLARSLRDDIYVTFA